MINHGLSTGALFLLVGIIYERRHTRLIADYGGLAKQMPIYATIFLIIALSSIGLPALNGFIGEFTILLGAFEPQHLVGGLRGRRHRARRGLPAVALPARLLGPLDNPTNQNAARTSTAASSRRCCRSSPAWSGSASPRASSSRSIERPVHNIVQKVDPDYYDTPAADLPAPAPVRRGPSRGAKER